MKEGEDLIDAYFDAKDAVHGLFAYRPDWVEIPLDDQRGRYWMLAGGEGDGGRVVYSAEPLTAESIAAGKTIYGHPIYTQRFLPKWVYRAKAYVLVCMDTQTDGNKFLAVFDADKETVDEQLRALYIERWG